MKEVYKEIWALAKPHYEKGRPYDIPHIEWMMAEVERLNQAETFDEDFLMPLCILHDVGYSCLYERNPNPKEKSNKVAHMETGAKIAKEILEEVNYPPELSKKIVKAISIHDNWCLGDDSPYKESKEMALFNDLDFLYAQSDQFVLKHQAESMGKKVEEMIEFWIKDEKHSRRPFCCEETKKMFLNQISARKKELFL